MIDFKPVLYLGFAVLAYWSVARRRGFRLWGIAAAVWGMICLAAVFLVQEPLKTQWLSVLAGSPLPMWFRQWTLALTSGVVQEGFKPLVPLLVAVYCRNRSSTVRPMVLGAAAGAGFGFMEATYILWGEPFGWVSTWERLSAILLHTGWTALVLWGFERRWLVLVLLPAIMAMHGTTNYIVFMLQSGHLSLMQLEVVCFVEGIVVIAAAMLLGRFTKPLGHTLMRRCAA